LLHFVEQRTGDYPLKRIWRDSLQFQRTAFDAPLQFSSFDPLRFTFVRNVKRTFASRFAELGISNISPIIEHDPNGTVAPFLAARRWNILLVQSSGKFPHRRFRLGIFGE